MLFRALRNFEEKDNALVMERNKFSLVDMERMAFDVVFDSLVKVISNLKD
jgi:hypothetical protein